MAASLLLFASAAWAQESVYNAQDLADLRAFLRQPSAEEGKRNVDQFMNVDTTTWETSTDWLWRVSSTWELVEGEQRLTVLNWFNKKLAGDFSMPHAEYLESVNLASNDRITSVDVSANANLQTLTLRTTGITTLDVSRNEALVSLTIASTALTGIDVSNNPNLGLLDMGDTKIEHVDVSKNPLLKNFYCQNSLVLSGIDFSNNLSLETVNCIGCTALQEIDLSSLANLAWFYCNNSGIRNLDLRGNTKLQSLQCSGTGMETLHLPASPVLSLIYCFDNELKTIEGLADLGKLQSFRAYNNQLRTLDVSGLDSLAEFWVSGNQLEEIVGLEDLVRVMEFRCEGNNLTSLAGLPTANMRRLEMQGNALRLSTMPVREKEKGEGPVISTEISTYVFYPQAIWNGGVVEPGTDIDLGTEAVKTFGDRSENTVFSWFDITGGTEEPIELESVEDGVFQTDATLAGKTLRCKMTNPFFHFNNGQENETDFPILYEIYVAGDETYVAAEVDALKNFLRQESALEGQTNASALDVDTAAWAESNLWLYRVQGLALSTGNEKRVEFIDWSGKDLAGNLDLSGFASLDSLYVEENALTALDLTGCDALAALKCEENALRFSTLPRVEPEFFTMAPQAWMDGGRTTYSEGIDLSAEYLVDMAGTETETEYRWVEVSRSGEVEVTSGMTDSGNGRFTLDTSLCGSTLRCYMTNEAYWGEEAASQLTLVYEVFVEYYEEPAYEAEALEQLRAFLRQEGNYAKLGLSDTAAWNEETSWVADVDGMEWEVSGGYYKAVEINWADMGLSGNLDLSGFDALRVLHLYDNDLTSVDVSDAAALTELRLYNNTRCASLDVKGCDDLERMYVQNCALTELDVASCDALRLLQAFNNRLTAFDASGKTLLETLYLHGNQLETIDLSGCGALRTLNVAGNRLAELNVQDCPDLSMLDCGDNALTFATLPKQDIASYVYAPQAGLAGEPILFTEGIDLGIYRSVTFPGQEAVLTDYAWYNVTTGEEIALPDSLELMVDDGNARFSIDESLSGTDLRCKMYNAAFPGLELVYDISLLETLDAYDEAELADLRAFLRQESQYEGILNAEQLGLSLADTLEWETSGKWIVRLANHGYVSLTEDPISGKKRVTGINFVAKGVAGNLDLRACTELTGLSCYANKLTGLDVSNSTKMQSLWCYNNQIPELDLSQMHDLVYLYCDQNKLKSLVLDDHEQLQVLRCGWNELEHLDVSGATALWVLECQNNQLAELDVTQNTKLTDLFVSNNFLTELDLSRNPELSEFHGSYNYFTFFDFATYNKKMWHLYLDHNLLEGIVLTDLVIETVDIRYNELTFSTIPFDFMRKDYYFAPQDTVDLGKFPADGTLDLTSEYMLDTDGSHSFFEWQIQSGSEWVETDDVIVMDETGLFVFDKDAEGNRYRCVITNNNPFRCVLTMEYYVDIVEPTSSESGAASAIEVSVYPNPVSDELHISAVEPMRNIRLFDMNGRVVYQQSLNDAEHSIDMESYPAGMYFLDVDGLLRKKVVKR